MTQEMARRWLKAEFWSWEKYDHSWKMCMQIEIEVVHRDEISWDKTGNYALFPEV